MTTPLDTSLTKYAMNVMTDKRICLPEVYQYIIITSYIFHTRIYSCSDIESNPLLHVYKPIVTREY